VKKSASKRKPKTARPKETTGLDHPFFLGGDSRLAGFMHYEPPRSTDEYEKMDDRALFRRISDDLEELLARAYPTYFDEWLQKIAPNYSQRFPINRGSRLRTVIHESVVESLCLGLMKKIRSSSRSQSRRALAKYQRLLDQFLTEEPKHAANALAFIAIRLATYLENLFVKRPELMREVAAEYDLWPVNLSLRTAIRKGERKFQLRRLTFARNYLAQLRLNLKCDFPLVAESGAELMSPFKLAAQDVYRTLLLFRDSQSHARRPNAWAKKLLALPVPMTKETAIDWWKVAKVYVDERWDTGRSEFKPLIKHLGFNYPIELSSKTPYESSIRSRVIDNDLKDAFIALARNDL